MLIPQRVYIYIYTNISVIYIYTYCRLNIYQLFIYTKLHVVFQKTEVMEKKSFSKKSSQLLSSGNTFCQGRATPYIGNGHSTLGNPYTGYISLYY